MPDASYTSANVYVRAIFDKLTRPKKPKVIRDKMIDGLNKVKKIATLSKLERLLHNPYKYCFAIAYRLLVYPRNKKEQLIETNRLKRDQRGCPYYFPVQGKKVDRIFVAEEMAEQLSLGLLAIVKSKDGVEVVPVKVARQIAERDPAVVLVLHDGGKENEQVA